MTNFYEKYAKYKSKYLSLKTNYLMSTNNLHFGGKSKTNVLNLNLNSNSNMDDIMDSMYESKYLKYREKYAVLKKINNSK